jgi:hypothetical protein
MPISNQKEEIDVRILRLIGLDDVFDLDYETYLTLIKEAMVKGRMTKKTIPTEEVMLLTDEYKRVKSKKDKGRFEVKKKKISGKSFTVGSVKGKIAGTATKALPGTSISASPLAKSLEGNISAITSAIVSISDTLRQQKKISDDASAYDRRKAEQEKRGLAESKLEKRFEGLKKIAEKIIAPVKSLLDRVIEFFTNIILGRIVYKLVEWLGDPKNESKVKSIIRFVKDWWPALLSSYILFGTSFGRFTLGLTKMVGGFIFRIGKVAIPSLLRLVARNPVASLAVAGGVGAYAASQQNEQKREGVKPGQGTPGAAQLQREQVLQRGFGGMFNGGGLARAFSGGGFANGFVSGEKGVDKIPAMLSDGEFVMSRGAVETWGLGTLEAMNAAGGGTNKPKIVRGTTYAAGGGGIGNIGDMRKHVIDIDTWFRSQGINVQDPKTYTGFLDKMSRQAQSSVGGSLSGIGNAGMNIAAQSQKYLQGGGLQKDISKLMQSGTQFGAGLYDQALKVGNQALSDIQSGKIQKKAMDAANTAAGIPKKAGVGFFDAFKKMGSSKSYQQGAAGMEKVQGKMISLGDKFIQKLPDGPFKEMADKGLIPIPSGNATMMRNLTFMKALLGPMGRPFKILSNKEVDEMRQKTIEKTMGKSGLDVDPKTGQVRMNWNQEDINKGAKGGGAYTDDLGPRGSSFNSILGRFSASTKPGGGNTLYSDDRYNFNRTVSEYAELAKQGLMKGSVSDATYFGASMLGRFAQDIGWLNQRALGSEIKIGTVNRNSLDPKTGRQKTKAQMAAEQSKMRAEATKLAKKRSNEEKVKSQRSWYDKLGWFGGGSKVIKQKQAQIAATKPKSAAINKSVKPKPKVTYVKPRGNQSTSSRGGSSKTKVPSFNASTKGSRTKADLIGVHR